MELIENNYSFGRPKLVTQKLNISKIQGTSSPKIEVKLLQKHQISSRKKEKLRKEQEEAELSVLRSKPKISKQSKKLAALAEEKFFSQFGIPLMPQHNDRPSKSAPKIPPPKSPLVRTHTKLTPTKALPIHPKSKKKKIAKQNHMFYMDVLQRNSFWQEQKEERLKKKTEEANGQEMKECTFSPVFYSRLPQMYQQYSPDSLKGLSKSKDSSCYNSFFEESLFSKSLIAEASPISPYQVKVSYKEGCNLTGFKARVK